MTRTIKILLSLSLVSFLVGLTGVSGAIGIPLGAIFLGLSMISKVMQKEVARYDEERRSRLALREENQPEENPRTIDRTSQDNSGEARFKAHAPAR